MKFEQPIWPRFLPTSTIVACATLGPIGRLRPGPGTWGSFAGLLYFTIFFWHLGTIGTLFFTALGCYFAVAICGEAEFRLGRRDPGEVILDEFVAIPPCFLGWTTLTSVAPEWLICLSGFVVFRVFDIFKPFGIAKLQDLPGGWGVVADDVAAALATCLTLHVIGWGLRSAGVILF